MIRVPYRLAWQVRVGDVLAGRRRSVLVCVPPSRGNGGCRFGRLSDHHRADGAQLDVAMAGKYVAFASDQARLVAALPDRSGAPMTGIKFGTVDLADALHHS